VGRAFPLRVLRPCSLTDCVRDLDLGQRLALPYLLGHVVDHELSLDTDFGYSLLVERCRVWSRKHDMEGMDTLCCPLLRPRPCMSEDEKERKQ